MLEQLFNTLSRDVDNVFLRVVIWVGALALTVVIGIILTKVLVKLLVKVLKKTNINPTAIPFIASISKIFCYVLLGISVTTSLGVVDASSIVTALGAVGLAVSLAVKDSLANLMGGVLLILSKSFIAGDYVDIDGIGGTVAEIGLLHTILKTPDNKRISIPNGQVTNARITNFSAMTTRRVDIYLTIERTANIEIAKRTLTAMIKAHPYTLETPAPAVRAEENNEFGTRISCKIWTESSHYWDLYYDLQEQLKGELDKAGISLATRVMLN